MQRLRVLYDVLELLVIAERIEVSVAVDDVQPEPRPQALPEQMKRFAAILGVGLRRQGVDAPHLVQVGRSRIAAKGGLRVSQRVVPLAGTGEHNSATGDSGHMVGVKLDEAVEHGKRLGRLLQPFRQQVSLLLKSGDRHRIELERFLDIREGGYSVGCRAILSPGYPAEFVRWANAESRRPVGSLSLCVAAVLTHVGSEEVGSSRCGASLNRLSVVCLRACEVGLGKSHACAVDQCLGLRRLKFDGAVEVLEGVRVEAQSHEGEAAVRPGRSVFGRSEMHAP